MKRTFFQKVIDPFVYLFWWLQISILHACPPLHGVTIKLAMNAERSFKLWIKTLFRVAVRAPRAFFLHLRDKKENRVVIPRISMGITTRCTLNCDKCIARIPDIPVQSRMHIPAHEVLQDIQTLFSCIDSIYDLNLSGGEAFLHPDLDKILRACAGSDKVGAVDVSTNGTVLPGAKLLAALKETNATVRITKYGPALQPNVEQLKSILKENGIPFLHEAGAYWYDTDNRGQLQEGSAKRRFGICAQKLCLSYFGGKLHFCSASLSMTELRTIPNCRDDYIDLRETSPAAFREQWRRLCKKRVISACSYCLGGAYDTPRIPVAVQRKPD